MSFGIVYVQLALDKFANVNPLRLLSQMKNLKQKTVFGPRKRNKPKGERNEPFLCWKENKNTLLEATKRKVCPEIVI